MQKYFRGCQQVVNYPPLPVWGLCNAPLACSLQGQTQPSQGYLQQSHWGLEQEGPGFDPASGFLPLLFIALILFVHNSVAVDWVTRETSVQQGCGGSTHVGWALLGAPASVQPAAAALSAWQSWPQTERQLPWKHLTLRSWWPRGGMEMGIPAARGN